jgi:hypothetical protein
MSALFDDSGDLSTVGAEDRARKTEEVVIGEA